METDFTIRPGWILIPRLSRTGGLRVEREIISSDSEKGQEESRIVRYVDDPEAHKWAEKILTSAKYILDSCAQETAVGYYVDEEMFGELRTRMYEPHEWADAFNEAAEHSGTARRVFVDYIPLPAEPDNEELTRVLKQDVLKRLKDLRDALRKGSTRDFSTAAQNCPHLERLAEGEYGRRIALALRNAKEARRTLYMLLNPKEETTTTPVHKKSSPPKKKRMTPAEAGRLLDLGPLEGAIQLLSSGGVTDGSHQIHGA